MIAKEISKIHETFYREDINNIKMFKNNIKGELTVIISRNRQEKKFDKEKIKTKQKFI